MHINRTEVAVVFLPARESEHAFYRNPRLKGVDYEHVSEIEPQSLSQRLGVGSCFLIFLKPDGNYEIATLPMLACLRQVMTMIELLAI